MPGRNGRPRPRRHEGRINTTFGRAAYRRLQDEARADGVSSSQKLRETWIIHVAQRDVVDELLPRVEAIERHLGIEPPA